MKKRFQKRLWVKGLCLALCFAMLVLGLYACKAPASQSDNQDGLEPAAEEKGFYTAEQSLTGGEQSLDVNLKDIAVSTEGEDTLICFSFVRGSLNATGQELPLEVTPYFVTGFRASPNRFALHLEGLSYWDFSTKPEFEGTGIVQGLFCDIPRSNASDVCSVYVQLSSDYVYQLDQTADQLIFRLRPIASTQTASAYFVSLNAYYEKSNYDFPQGLSLYPCLCKNGRDITLLSDPFTTQAEAENHQQIVQTALEKDYGAKVVKVLELAPFELPDYDTGADVEGVEQKQVIKTNSGSSNLPVLVSDGRFLAWQPGGESFLFAKPILSSSVIGSDVSWSVNEELWLYQAGGRQQQLVNYEFASILQVGFSSDGSMLAIMEMLDELRVLYLYDMHTRKITALTEVEFGLDTMSFAWSETGHTLYAVTGDSSYYSLMSLDASTPGARAQTVLKDPDYVERMAAANGLLYVLSMVNNESTGEMESWLFSWAPEDGGVRTQICPATGFTLSPDGRRAIIWNVVGYQADGLGQLHEIKLLDLSTGSASPLFESEHYLLNAVFDTDNRYFVVLDTNDDDDRLYFAELYREDAAGKPEWLCDMVSSEIYAGESSSSLILADMYVSQGNYIPVTYELVLDAIK